MYLISVYFDDNTNRILQKHIDRVAERTGNTFMPDNKVPPHITISSVEARNVDVLIPAFKSLCKELGAGDIRFVSTGQLFPYVIFVTPVLNRYLQELQEKVYLAINDIEDTAISKFYQPYSWLPHVTIGKKLDKEQMREAFATMQDAFVPFDGKITGIGLAKVNPHEDVLRFDLTE